MHRPHHVVRVSILSSFLAASVPFAPPTLSLQRGGDQDVRGGKAHGGPAEVASVDRQVLASPVVTTPRERAMARAQQPASYMGFRVGRYEGQIVNTQATAPGKAQLDLLSISTTGAVRAHLREFDGLEGEGDLTGAINTAGVLQLRGAMRSPSDGSVWQSATIGVLLNGALRFGQRLTLNGQEQQETATLAFTGLTVAATAPAGPVAPPVAARAPAAASPAPLPAAAAAPAAAAPAPAVGAQGARGGVPVGLYLHTSDGSYVDAFYFGAQGRIHRGLEGAFTAAGLAAGAPSTRGTYQLTGTQLIITTDDGKTISYAYKTARGRHYLENIELATVVPAPAPASLVGSYTASGGYGALSSASSLELRADGTYSRSAVGAYRTGGGTIGGSTDDTGSWQYANHTLTFRSANGTVTQQIALVPAPGSIVAAMGAIYVGGTYYRRRS